MLTPSKVALSGQCSPAQNFEKHDTVSLLRYRTPLKAPENTDIYRNG